VDVTDEEREEIEAGFGLAAHVEPAELRSWLMTAPSKTVGWPKDRAPGVESVGHASGDTSSAFSQSREAS
jgi:hypothetical protein